MFKCPKCRSLLVAPLTPATSDAASPASPAGAAGFAQPSAAPPPYPPAFVPSPPLVTNTTSSSKSRSSAKTWAKRGVFLAVAILVYGGIVNSHRDYNPYSHAHQEAFVAGCQDSGAAETTCRCTFDWIKQNVSASDYKAYAHLVTSPGYTASQTPAWMLQATRSCLPAANG
jgi:hypothetical protein